MSVKYDQNRDVGRIFRKWRRQTLHVEKGLIQEFQRRVQVQKDAYKKVAYERRKGRLLTALQLKITQIQLKQCFLRYWSNIKQLFNLNRHLKWAGKNETLQEIRENHLQLRRQEGGKQTSFEKIDRLKSVDRLLRVMRQLAMKECFQEWRKDSKNWKLKRRAVRRFAFKKDNQYKVQGITAFRRVMQYCQKKQLHAILTDLNNKMETINEKSTICREQLRLCIENLAHKASLQMGSVFALAEAKCKKTFFNKSDSIHIRQTYLKYRLTKTFFIFQNYCITINWGTIKRHLKQNKKQTDIQIIANQHITKKKKFATIPLFMQWKKRTMFIKKGMKKCIHVQNVLFFYRIAYTFASIQTKSFIEKQKKQIKQKNTLLIKLQQKKNFRKKILESQNKLINQLKQLFHAFCIFQQRKMKIKRQIQKKNILKFFFNKFNKKAKAKGRAKTILENIRQGITEREMRNSWKRFLETHHSRQIQMLQDQLTKINKKRKAQQQKLTKNATEIKKKIESEENNAKIIHQKLYFVQIKYNNVLEYVKNQNEKKQQKQKIVHVWNSWKQQWKRIIFISKAISHVLERHFKKDPFQMFVTFCRKLQCQIRSHELCEQVLLKRVHLCMKDVISIWQCNSNKKRCMDIQRQIQNIDLKEASLLFEFKEKTILISQQIIRNKKKKQQITIFQAIKNLWNTKKLYEKKIAPLLQKERNNILTEKLREWKWIIYIKRVEKNIVTQQKLVYEKQLQNDVINAWRINVLEHHRLFETMEGMYLRYERIRLHQGLNCIINFGANEKNKLWAQRRKILQKLIFERQAHKKTAKLKVLHKWRALLIPRFHYLINMLQEILIRHLKKAFAAVNQQKYWHESYVLGLAQDVTREGYARVNTLTLSLISEGCDPDEVKQYLATKNGQDSKVIMRVVSHLRAWGGREKVVRSFHSWQQFVRLKKQIRSKLTRALNVSGGLGKYWSRWRAKDEVFNEALKKQSRTLLLTKYQQLSRLFKQYRRDVADSALNLEEMQQTNSELQRQQQTGWLMAANALSASIRKALRQGLILWREGVNEGKKKRMDSHYDELVDNIQQLKQRKKEIKVRLAVREEMNKQLRQKCTFGAECGAVLQHLLNQKDQLSIHLADKEHNMHLLLQDNLRLKQKIQIAKNHAQKLLRTMTVIQ